MTFNKASLILRDECGVDLAREGCDATTVGELIEEASELILPGGRRDCRLAAVNRGVVLTDGP